MLVLTRKLGERVVIADSIIVTVVQVSGDRVRLAFEAPADVRILREELRARPQQLAPAPAASGVGDG